MDLVPHRGIGNPKGTMKTTLKLIGLVGRFDQLNGNININKMVTLSIATLDIEDGVWTTRNFRRDSETPKGCAGGLSCRLFGSQWEFRKIGRAISQIRSRFPVAAGEAAAA